MYGFKEKRAHKARDMQFFLQNVQNVIFKILEMFKNNKTSHSWYSYFVTIVGHYYGGIIKVLNAVELHLLQFLKVNCSTTACSSSIRPIFDK